MFIFISSSNGSENLAALDFSLQHNRRLLIQRQTRAPRAQTRGAKLRAIGNETFYPHLICILKIIGRTEPLYSTNLFEMSPLLQDQRIIAE